MKLLGTALVVVTLALPAVAQAQQRLTEDQLIELAINNKVCGDRQVVAAQYDAVDPNRVAVTCGEDAEGFVPLAAGLGLGGAGAAAGLVLVAVAAGGGGSTPSTNGTN